MKKTKAAKNKKNLPEQRTQSDKKTIVTTAPKQAEKALENLPAEKIKFISHPFIQRIQTAGQIEQDKERIRKDAERNKMIEKVVKEIDDSVTDPVVMECWRKQIAVTFQRREIKDFKGNNGTEILNGLLKNFTGDMGIDVLYLILALAHDDLLSFNRIIDEKLRQQATNLCSDVYAYGRQGLSGRLDVFLNHIKARKPKKPSENPKNTMAINVIPQHFKVTSRTIYRWIKIGRLISYPDTNGLITVDATEVAKYAKRIMK